jgi:hypothetical protein
MMSISGKPEIDAGGARRLRCYNPLPAAEAA